MLALRRRDRDDSTDSAVSSEPIMDKAHILAEIRRAAEADVGRPPGQDRFLREISINCLIWFGFASLWCGCKVSGTGTRIARCEPIPKPLSP
jgi:hypothetical protein